MNEEERNEAEWAFAQILQNPVLFREFINEDDPNIGPLEQHERAWSTCKSHYVCMCCGRSVHKTTTMIEMLYFWMINKMFIPGDPGLFVLVPNKAQKDLSFPKIRAACQTHWLISRLVDKNKINVTDGKIEFLNGFTLIMRIAGSAGSEANVIGLHTARIWVDEAQDIPWYTWQSLQNSLKKEIPDFMLWVSGVPNGGRRENVLFECDQLDPDYISFNISQEMMSWWSDEMEYTARKKYYAVQEDSEDYKHFVLGQHGVPVYAVFDRLRMLKENYEAHKEIITQDMLEGTKRSDPDGEIRYHINEALYSVPDLPQKHGVKPMVGLGYDVGFRPDPAVFFIIYKDVESGVWRNILRVVLQGVEYALQREILLYLDRIYEFDFMGIDMGGPGKVQYQDLTGELSDAKFKEREFSDRIFPVEFGGHTVVALRTEQGEEIEKKDQTKRVAVDALSRWIHEHRLSFDANDDDLMSELERTKMSRSIAGEPVYKTEGGNGDHQMAALMCAIMAYESEYGTQLRGPRSEIKPRLLPARWLDTSKVGVFASSGY